MKPCAAFAFSAAIAASSASLFLLVVVRVYNGINTPSAINENAILPSWHTVLKFLALLVANSSEALRVVSLTQLQNFCNEFAFSFGFLSLLISFTALPFSSFMPNRSMYEAMPFAA